MVRKELVAVMVGAAFTIAMATMPGTGSWTVAIVSGIATAILLTWWLTLYVNDVRDEQAQEVEVARRLDVLSKDQRNALRGLIWRGSSTHVDREHLERVRERTGLVKRDFTGDFSLDPENAAIVKRLLEKPKQ